jgi:hypothetical protein
MKFSQRIGKTRSIKDLQIQSIDKELLNGLWNLTRIHVIDNISTTGRYGGDGDFPLFASVTWHNYYKLPIDSIPRYPSGAIEYIRERFFSDPWYEVYDFIEFLSGLTIDGIDRRNYIKDINTLLEKEFSAYRFINNQISPITNQVEIEEIDNALRQIQNFTSLEGANIHLSNALDKLSDRIQPDFRNSIKESISAVETVCRVLTGESTLGKAINKLEAKGLQIDEQFKAAIEKLYASTNNKQSGIRHAIIEEHKKLDFEDAKYMFVVCSAFINFLLGKCKSLRIDLQ